MPQFRFFLQPKRFALDADNNLKLLFTLRVLRDFINALAFFFLPIFLYEFGKDVHWIQDFGFSDLQKGILVITTFFLVERSTVALTIIPVGKLIPKLGFTTAMFFSHLIRVGGFIFLCYFQGNPWALFGAAFLEGLQSNFFWPSYFSIFSDHAHLQRMGKDLGMVQFFLQLLAVFTPAVGGYLALNFGYTSLYFLAIAGCLFSAFIPLVMEFETTRDRVSWKEFKRWYQQKAFKRLSVSFVGRYFYDSVLFLWPLFIFLIVGSVEKVGFMYTFALFLAMLMVFFVGSYIDETKTKKSFFLGGGLVSFLWFIRTQVWTVWGIVLVDAIEKVAGSMYWLFYDMITMRRSKGSQAFSYFIYRELVVSVTGAAFWLFLGLAFFFIGKWNFVFIIGGIGVLFSLLLTEHHHAKLK